MRLLLFFLILLLPIFAGAGLASAQESTPAPPSDEPPAPEVVTFADRFASSSTDAQQAPVSKLPPVSSPLANNACVLNQSFRAYGFYSLGDAAGEVDFSVYSRVLYYSLTPGPLGNITIPKDWTGPKVTQAAHKHGAKVDLVISNATWNFDSDVPESTKAGLRLVKSYVLLNMVDEIVDTVNQFGFDGVVIDFRLPGDSATQESFTFFIKRLKDRLKADKVSGRANDLLKPAKKQLSVVIDGKSTGDQETTTDNSKQIVTGTFESVDLWLVKEASFEIMVRSYLVEAAPGNPGATVPVTAIILSEETPDPLKLDRKLAAMWDVAVGGKGWGPILQDDMFDGLDPKHTISSLICTKRTIILGALSAITPFLVFMLVLSWLVYDLPKFIKKYKPTLVLWGLLAVVSILFLILIYSLPSLDLKHFGVYVILASLAIPLGYIIWNALSRLSKPDYP